MSSRIRIEIYAGLCNRMRVLDSAIELAKSSSAQLDVIWNLERKFNCKFEELFIVPKYINKIMYRDVHTMRGKIARNLGYFHNIKLDNRFYRKDIKRLRYNNTKLLELTRDKTTFISTDDDFFSHNAPFKDFTVQESLLKKIASYTEQFDKIVGVHIRRSDHKKSRKYSPTSLFIKYMKNELILRPESRFFLATDSPQVEAHLVGIFQDRIIIHPKRSLDRNDPVAIKDALIDLYCLASCKKIFGSYWSSFTATASQINGAEMIIVKIP